MGRAKPVAAGRNTTTEVVGKLYGRGLTISRDRLYTMTELIFDNTDVQPRHGLRRYYTDEQIELLAAAFWLKEAGRDDDEIAALFRSPETAAEVQRLVDDHLRWLDSLEELAARATTTA
jgi:DNA-binding transcriptional MerR regulator